MKISMFTNTYLPHVGGVARSVSTFAEELRKEGHAVQIIAPTFPGQQDESETDVLRVPALQKFNGSDFSLHIPLSGRISETVEKFKPDLIHSHHPFLLGDTALRLSRSLRRPLVFTHHTYYEKYTHYVPLDSPLLKRFVIELGTKYANLCNQVIAPSRSVRELLLQRGVRTNITVLPTGIDIAAFAGGDGMRFRKEHAIEADTPIIGHVGRLAEEKNLPYLARAVASAVQQNDNIIFLVVGKGDADETIRSIFSDNNVGHRLMMTGNLTGHRLSDSYAAMDLFAFASTSETQGLVLAEAMAASTPVVALSASGVDDVMINTVNGTLLPANTDSEEFCQALLAALRNRQQLEKWKRNASETAGKFSIQSCTAQLVALYRRTIEESHAADLHDNDQLESAIMVTIKAIQTEWELLQEKTMATINSITDKRK